MMLEEGDQKIVVLCRKADRNHGQSGKYYQEPPKSRPSATPFMNGWRTIPYPRGTILIVVVVEDPNHSVL